MISDVISTIYVNNNCLHVRQSMCVNTARYMTGCIFFFLFAFLFHPHVLQ